MLLKAEPSATEGTRERILDAALDLFGERGLTGTTVRDIARRAAVNVAAISYHFGGKEELYRAVATSIADHLLARIGERAASAINAQPTNPEAGLAALETLLETVLDAIVGPPEMRRVARFMLREQMQPTAAFDVIYGSLSRLHIAACRLLAAASGSEAETAETRVRAFMLVGQVLVLRVAEAAVQRRLDIDAYDDAFMESAKTLLKENVRAIVAASRESKP